MKLLTIVWALAIFLIVAGRAAKVETESGCRHAHGTARDAFFGSCRFISNQVLGLAEEHSVVRPGNARTTLRRDQ